MRGTIALVFLSSLLVAGAAGTTTFVVPPGPGTPVQDAIDAAQPGDTIRLTLGLYPEHVQIFKAIKLRGVRSTSVDIDATTRLGGGCGVGPTIRIFANDVQIRGILVLADTLGGVSLQGNRIKLTDVFAVSQCGAVSAPLYDVEQSTSVKLNKVWAAGTQVQTIPAGIRIADTVKDGRIRIQNSIAGHNEVGVLLENNGIGAVRVSHGAVNFNDRGIVLQNTSRAIVDHNELVDNTVSGIELDATSSGNTIVGNAVSGSATDVSDAGAANCWRNNRYTTGSVPSCQ